MTAQSFVGALRSGSGKPTRDRQVDARAVPCPTCKSPIGFPCVSASGQVTHHAPRRRMALRAETSSYDVGDVTYARRVPTHTRQALRERSGLSRDALAELCGVPRSRVGGWETGASVPAGHAGSTYGRWLQAQLDNQHP